MKRILQLALLIMLVSGVSCEKEQKLETSLDGTWELRHFMGGMIPNPNPDYAKGNGMLVVFEGSEVTFVNPKYEPVVTTFSIVKDEITIDGTKYSHKLVFEKNRPDNWVTIIDSGKKLKISFGSIALDAGTSTYERL